MEIVNLKIEDLTPYEKNAKRHPQEQVDQIADSIRKFGMNDPIGVWGDKNIIVEGHGRYLACKFLGIKEVPCIRLDNLTDAERKEYTLIHNKTTMNSGFEDDILQEELAWIYEHDKSIDMSKFDFALDIEEEENEEAVEDNYDGEENLPEEPVAQFGDIYQLGEHRLMCGDSTNKENVERLMGGELADLLFTDPPYNVSMESKSKEVLKSKNYSHIENDDLSLDDFQDFLRNVFTNANDALKDEASYYVFSCQGGDSEMMMMMRECGIKCRHQIIWVKDAPVFSMGRLDYDYKHEPILYGWKKKHTFYRKGDQDKSVWEFKRTANKLHPTMKPVELIANALKNSTQKEDVVLDLFGGSGSTLIACEQLGRKCRMMEFDRHYVDVIIDRWQTLTGKKAVKLN